MTRCLEVEFLVNYCHSGLDPESILGLKRGSRIKCGMTDLCNNLGIKVIKKSNSRISNFPHQDIKIMKTFAIFLISLYQHLLSPLLVTFLGGRPICRYSVSCSEYTKQAIRKKGVISGILLGGKRVLSCSPFHK